MISLTSYGPRFPTLHLTLACLFDQTVRPDNVILWVAHHDLSHLPKSVKSFQSKGLDIRTCEDLGPFKKLIPTMEAFDSAFIVTADDDVHYDPDWLETLIAGYDGNSITCLRADRAKLNDDGTIAPYVAWDLDVSEGGPATDLVPVGVRGVLYPPGALHAEVTDRKFMELCPRGDDLWFFWMARLIGTKIRKVGIRKRAIAWRDSQSSALWNENGEYGGNDRMIAALEKGFGKNMREIML